jgi:hypothetical protein
MDGMLLGMELMDGMLLGMELMDGMLLGMTLVDGGELTDGMLLGMLVGLSVRIVTEPVLGLPGVRNMSSKIYHPPEGSSKITSPLTLISIGVVPYRPSP